MIHSENVIVNEKNVLPYGLKEPFNCLSSIMNLKVFHGSSNVLKKLYTKILFYIFLTKTI